MNAWLKKARRGELLTVIAAAVFTVGCPVFFFTGDHERAWYYLLLSTAWWSNALLRSDLRLAKRMPPNSVLLTTPSEPSSDARQAARMLTDYRTALINEGMSAREATEFLTSWAAKVGGES